MGFISACILEEGLLTLLKVEVVGNCWHRQKKLQRISPFRMSVTHTPLLLTADRDVCNSYVFFANRGSGLRHAFFVSVIFPKTCDGLDPLCVGSANGCTAT